jgi:release factor glutamine methyltransferase
MIMNTNLQPKTPITIKYWLNCALAQLQDNGVTSALLDAELIVAETINKDRAYLHGHDDDVLVPSSQKLADEYLRRRLKLEPLAYILGYKEFFGHQFIVSPKVLIPRPESEGIIEALSELAIKKSSFKLVDIGTGCGCLGISAKLLFPKADVTLSDISSDALKIASKNASTLGAEVNIIKSDLLNNFSGKADVLIANLPYVDSQWTRSRETDFEPGLALFSSDNGLNLIKRLISSTPRRLIKGGYLIIEADPRQHSDLINYANERSFETISQKDYVLVFKSY